MGTHDVVRARELSLLAVFLLEDYPDRAQQLPVRLVRGLLCKRRERQRRIMSESEMGTHEGSS